ncbi:terminase gpA endonuclease subunit [Escherichia coli]|uniref:terminase gpA endonuclease subunit n=30 Tax=Enterobacteriaceae TaxID=543 RepID=UPI0021F434A0|nr:phage terminase large subunit family protein [Escherichia coli]WFX65002.1 phage terminase large subunit family protein [Escherichia coli]WFX74014.1 phage terminase large subunit family protein [Escherichia coli]
MNISNSQVNRLRHFVRAGLRSLFRPEPQTAVEWADANYYLPKESAYQEGRWETLPFQRAIMNAMGSDYVREVNVVKSARVGYSKMLLGVYAYFIEHKQRNTLIWLPTDGDAENFMKTHVEPTIRDIPSLLALAPWYGKKHRDNTLTMKRFSNGRGFWCLGGKAAKNYREKSVDVAGYDELAAFDEDIEQEGSPTFLGDKRIEGSVWPKSIRGSTPKVRGTCQIERAASESPHFMRFHVACPHCGEEQYLKFGDKETPFGLKWTPDDPSSVFYLCEHNACVIRQQELDFTDARYICEKTGIWTRDGILWFSSSGEEIEPPDSVTFHIWTAYSPFTTWVQIVKDWMKTKGDTGKRKTFVNTTLGETWEAKIGERPDAEVMAERKEHYSAPVPDRVAYLTAGIDSQLDRYEMRVWGWGPGEESWLIDRQIIMGRHDDEQTLQRVDEAINKTYTRRNGAEMSVSRICWDTGGIDPTIVYERSKKHGLFRVIPIKGASVYGNGSERLVSTARTTETTYRFTQLALGNYRLTVRAVNAWGQQGDPASVSFRIAAPAAPSRIELTPGYFQITATPHLAVYDPTVQFEFWFSEKRIADIRQVETTARYLGTALYWIAASINIRPGHNYYFYVRSVNTVGKSAFVEAVGQPSDDASGYLDFFKGEIGKTHLAQELWTQIDNGQLAPDLAEIRTSITDVSNEITQTVNKKLEDQSAAIQQIQKVQVDTNNNLNSMWAVKLQQMQDGRLYIAGIGAGIENTPDGMQSQVLLAADRIAMINPANGNTKPMFVGQGDQIFMNEVFLKYLTAPTITSGGNPPAFSLTPDGKLTAKNADISGSVNANAGTLNNVTINENCQIKGKLSANQIEGDIVKTVGKAFPRDSRAPERWPSGTITVRIYDDQPFDRQIVIPAVAFSGAKHEREHTDIYSSCRLIVKKNGAEIYNRTALDNTLIYSGVIDMPAGHGHMTLEFSVSAWLVNDWYPTASISDLLVVVMKKATAGISIS